MPRFYFHLCQNGEELRDPEGIEIADPAMLRIQAVAIARDLVAADATTGLVDLNTRLIITDEKDVQVLELTFADAVAFVSGGQD